MMTIINQQKIINFLNLCKDFSYIYKHMPHLINEIRDNWYTSSNQKQFFNLAGINDEWPNYINAIKEITSPNTNQFKLEKVPLYKQVKVTDKKNKSSFFITDYLTYSNVTTLVKYLTIYSKLYNLQFNSNKDISIKTSYSSYSSLTGNKVDMFDSFFTDFDEYVINLDREEDIAHELGHILLHVNKIFLPRKIEEGLITLMIEPYNVEVLSSQNYDFDTINNCLYEDNNQIMYQFYQIVTSFLIMKVNTYLVEEKSTNMFNLSYQI